MGKETRALPGFMSSSDYVCWIVLSRVIDHLKGPKIKGILCIEPESHEVIGFDNADFRNYIETMQCVVHCLIIIGGYVVY